MNTKEIICLFGSLFILGMAINLRITEGDAGGYALMCIPAAFYIIFNFTAPINNRNNKRKYYK